MYELTLEQFQGPLDLLLHLIEKAKIDIKDIFISEITSQYIDYIEKNKSNMDDVSEFLSLAATLLYIKSKKMLPSLKIDDDEEDIEQKFITELEEYKKFKKVSMQIKMDIEETPRVFTKLKDEFQFIEQRFDLQSISLEELSKCFQEILKKRKIANELPDITSKKVMRHDKYTIPEKMDIIMTRLNKKNNMEFEELLDGNEIGDLVITFLSILELINDGKLLVYQSRVFGKIIVEKSENIDG